jgi:hypothetical protein
MTQLAFYEVAAWGLIVAALIYAAMEHRSGFGGAVLAAVIGALVTKTVLLELG